LEVISEDRLEVDSALKETGAKIADARRQAGLSQRALASRLGLSIWKLDQLEHGNGDSSRFTAGIEAATGQSESWFAPPRLLRADDARAGSVGAGSYALDTRDSTGRNFVLGAITLLVVIRFFTEVIHVIPRAANFVDIPIALVLLLAAAARPAARHNTRIRLAVAAPVLLFALVSIISTIANLPRVETGPVLVFLYGFLAPVAIYASVYQLWPAWNAKVFSRLLICLGVAQLVVVFTIDLARFSTTHNPDDISGTFGTNQNQLVFFLLILASLLAGIFTFERQRLAARSAPVLMVLTLVAILLAQYRALLATVALSILLAAALLSTRGRGLVAGLLVSLAFLTALSYVVSHFPNLKFASTVATYEQRPGFYVSKKLSVFHTIAKLYSDDPRFILTGTGPGTFSSRAFQTFANVNSTSRSNVQGRYVKRLTGGRAYSTDVSEKYVTTPLRNSAVIEGSHQLSSPYFTYLALLAEVGVPGLIAIVAIYLMATTRVLSLTVRNLRVAETGDPLPALLIATSISFIALLQMGFLENWFETTRATFLVWTMLAVATKELSARSTSAS
jgi:transcriptional regulator with XRE-family HTH domain